VDEFRIAVKSVAIGKGELGRFDLKMNELGTDRTKRIQVKTLEQSERLQRRQALGPWSGLHDSVAPVVVRDRRFDGRLPAGHVLAREDAAVTPAGRVHDLLRAAETIDGLCDKALRPG